MLRPPPRSTLFPTRRSSDLVVRDPPALNPDRLRQELGLPTQGPLIVATVGSGSDGYPVLRSEEHTSELQSHVNLVCRLLLEKKNHEDRQFSPGTAANVAEAK